MLEFLLFPVPVAALAPDAVAAAALRLLLLSDDSRDNRLLSDGIPEDTCGGGMLDKWIDTFLTCFGNCRQDAWSAIASWKSPNALLNASIDSCTFTSSCTWSRMPRSAWQSPANGSVNGSICCVVRGLSSDCEWREYWFFFKNVVNKQTDFYTHSLIVELLTGGVAYKLQDIPIYRLEMEVATRFECRT